MKKNIYLMIIAVALPLLCSCGGAGSNSNTSPTTQISPVPPELSSMLSSECSDRPTAQSIHATINGINYDYTEILSEQDEGNEIDHGSSILVSNKIGRIVFRPSSDNKVLWAARKWSLGKTEAESRAALDTITIRSESMSNQARIVVNHPQNIIPLRYEVCLVVLAPPAWEAHLINEVGDILSENHAGSIMTDNDTGETIITQNGTGFITANSHTGTITAHGDSRGGSHLVSGTGSIQYTLINGGVALQAASHLETDTGEILLTLEDGFGLNMTATTTTGTIIVPSFFPNPVEHTTTGQNLNTEINGGGETLSIHSDTGLIHIETQ